MSLYHGTSVSPVIILSEGLKPININSAIERVINKYNLNGHLTDVFKNRVADYVRRKRKHRFVYLTNSFDTAVQYTKYGSNFIGLLEIEAANLIDQEWTPNRIGYVYIIDLFDKSYDNRNETKVLYVPPYMITGCIRLDLS